MTQVQEQTTIRKENKKLSKGELARKLEEMRERDNELVTGIFRYIEHPKGTLRFRFKRYAQDEYKAYELVDGQKYKLPRMVARHLNNNVHYVEYKRLDNFLSDEGHAVMGGATGGELKSAQGMDTAQKIPRCEFRSLEFMDDDIAPSNLIQVSPRL